MNPQLIALLLVAGVFGLVLLVCVRTGHRWPLTRST